MQQFLPASFNHLTLAPTIQYKGANLKTDYIINIIHELILRYDITEDSCHNISATIMKKKYGKTYNLYIDYLLDNRFLYMSSDYCVSKKTRTYRLNVSMLHDRIRVDVTDKFLLKKYSREWITKTLVDMFDSPIEPDLRQTLIDDLYHVRINHKEACAWVEAEKASGLMDDAKYSKNKHSIDCINSGHLFYKFDSYGRMHTNFTVLKKHARTNFLTIDGLPLDEIDINNSQPFFLGVLIRNELTEERISNEIELYIDTVNNGLLYDELTDRYPGELKTRKDAKMMVYKVLFGVNCDRAPESKMFRDSFPAVYDFIKEYKKLNGDYKRLSHELQRLESNFIFNNVARRVKDAFPHIRLFTVHDSIMFPSKYREEVGIVFREELRKLTGKPPAQNV